MNNLNFCFENLSFDQILDNKEFVRIKNKDAIARLLKFFQSNGVYFPNNLSIQIPFDLSSVVT